MFSMKDFPVLLVVALSLVPGNDLAQASSGVVIKRGLTFSEAAPSLTLDLYLPTGVEKPVPCIVVIQGGGFLPQDGQRMKPLAEFLTPRNFAAALISYRGRPRHRYPDTLADVRAAVRYVRRNHKTYGIDPDKIGATGYSAGGTLAALSAVAADQTDPQSRVQAAVCFAGVYDFVGRFTDLDQLALQPGHETKIKTNGEWIGPPFSPTDADWLAASAITHVDAQDPPVLFLHSRDDSVVPWQQARDMHRAMIDAHAPAEIKIYETGGHGVRPDGENSLDAMAAFFRQHLLKGGG